MTAGGRERPAAGSVSARRRFGTYAIAAAVAGAAALWLAIRSRGPLVEEWRVARATVRPVAAATGTILPPPRVAVYPGVIGRIAKVLVRPGQAVRSGDPVVELDAAAYSAQADEARIAAARAEEEAGRAADSVAAAARKLAQARGLAGKKIASREYLAAAALDAEKAKGEQERARAALAAARSRLAAAREALARTRVAAPVPGEVAEVPVRAGETVSEKTPVAVVVDASTLLASVRASAPAAAGIGPGAPARVAAGGASAAGVVRTLEPNKTGDSPYVTVMIALTSPPGVLRPGMEARARIEGTPRDGVLVVPVSALAAPPRGVRGASAVWTVADGRVRRRAVEIGASGDRLAEVASGLREGEAIVGGPASAVRRLGEGDRVRVAARKGD